MSHFRKAMATAAMAVTAAGGGLLITGAGAVPAYAATQMPPLGGPPAGHVVATITFQRAAPAASGPSVILPCAVHSPGAAPAAWPPPDDTCDSGIITCDVTAEEPTLLYNRTSNDYIDFFAETRCSEEVPQISMGQDVIHSTPIDPNNPLTNSDVKMTLDSPRLITVQRASRASMPSTRQLASPRPMGTSYKDRSTTPARPSLSPPVIAAAAAAAAAAPLPRRPRPPSRPRAART